jgi:methionyl-tRNA formyltransferase
MDKGMDSGNIIYQEKINIDQFETYKTLYDKLSDLSYSVLTNYVDKLFDENLKSIKQNEKLITYAPIISSSDEIIDWNKTMDEIDAKIRGLYDIPIAYSIYDNQRIKILQAKKVINIKAKCGEIAKIDKEGILIGCLDGGILLTRIQLPSKQPIYIKELVNGRHLFKVNGLMGNK